jgi:hypothetical protein
MAVTEESRDRLFKQLEDTLGAEHANTLMGHLPPVGWADVATKGDIEILRNHVDTEIGGLRPRWAGSRVSEERATGQSSQRDPFTFSLALGSTS